MAKGRKKPPRRCIFCGGGGVAGNKISHEHVFSDWLSQIIPKSTAHFVSLVGGRDHEGNKIPDYLFKEKQGALHSKKFLGVCERCNNEWMSDIVKAAKPYVKRLIKAETFDFDVNAQLAVASWLSLVAIVADRVTKTRHKFPPSDLEHMFKHHAPPPHWHIEIGRYDQFPDRIDFDHAPVPLVMEDTRTGEVKSDFIVHSISALFGRLFITLYCANPSGHLLARALPTNLYRTHLVPIWPAVVPIAWPLPLQAGVFGVLAINGGMAKELSMRLAKFMQTSFIKAGITMR